MTNKVELLMAARDVIKDDRNWSKTYFAQNSEGIDCDVMDSDAQMFCALGAIAKVTTSMNPDDKNINYDDARKLLDHCIPEDFDVEDTYCRVAMFNDNSNTKHSDVIGLFNKAIEYAVSHADDMED